MTPATVFDIHLLLGYVPWLLCFGTYVWPKLKSMDHVRCLHLAGSIDMIVDYYRGNQIGLPALAGELVAMYAIPIIYVPLLMITHVAAFYLLLRPQARVSEA